MRMKKLLRNTVLLTSSSLLMRMVGMLFQIWLIGRIGAAGIGLYELVMSVGALCATVAVSGVRFSSTRLISEELGHGRPGGVKGAMQSSIGYGIFFGVLSGLLLLLSAERIGFLWIGDARTVRSLRVLALSMPFLSLSSVFYGYFTAVGRVYKSAVVQILSQLTRIALVMLLLQNHESRNLENSCLAVTSAGTLAELFGFLLFLPIYMQDRKKHFHRHPSSGGVTGRLLRLALPLAFSAYARTGLSSLQHLLVPRELKKLGRSQDAALAGYGTVHGMAFPIILFPSCLLIALAELLVPELTEAQVSGRDTDIASGVKSLLRRTFLFSSACAAFLYVTGDALGALIYHSEEAGHYIRILAPLIPVMYLDTVTDGCLKGLGQMMWSMAVNILDAFSGVCLVLLLIPRCGLYGYIAAIYLTEIANFVLSIGRLRSITGLQLFSASSLSRKNRKRTAKCELHPIC